MVGRRSDFDILNDFSIFYSSWQVPMTKFAVAGTVGAVGEVGDVALQPGQVPALASSPV